MSQKGSDLSSYEKGPGILPMAWQDTRPRSIHCDLMIQLGAEGTAATTGAFGLGILNRKA